jgi:hypothetical protein
VEPSFFHVPLWMLAGAYQPLGGMPTRVRREVTPPIPDMRVTISVHASHQTQSLLGQVRLVQATKHDVLHQAMAGLNLAVGPGWFQAAYQTDPRWTGASGGESVAAPATPGGRGRGHDSCDHPGAASLGAVSLDGATGRKRRERWVGRMPEAG